MLVQYILILAALVLAIFWLVKKISTPFREKSCTSACGCASSELRKEIRKT